MKFCVPKEPQPETRVAMVPEVAKLLIKKGHQLSIQAGAGLGAFITDEEYTAAGCQIVLDLKKLYDEIGRAHV